MAISGSGQLVIYECFCKFGNWQLCARILSHNVLWPCKSINVSCAT